MMTNIAALFPIVGLDFGHEYSSIVNGTLRNRRMTEFYVIMLKRQDGKVYADLHKTNQVIYLTIEDAYEEWNNNEHFKEYYHIVKLIACLDEELK